jgi:P27 family predicted phage terminase small subunit
MQKVPIPDDLDDEGRRVWRETVKSLRELDLFEPVTAQVVALYVRALQVARLARERIDVRLADDGPTAAFFSKGSMGQMVEHPDLGIARRAEQDARQLAGELLITPASRRRLKLEGVGALSLRDIESLLGSER